MLPLFTFNTYKKTNTDQEFNTSLVIIVNSDKNENWLLKKRICKKMKKCIYLGCQKMKADTLVRLISPNAPRTNEL